MKRTLISKHGELTDNLVAGKLYICRVSGRPVLYVGSFEGLSTAGLVYNPVTGTVIHEEVHDDQLMTLAQAQANAHENPKG
jgi:hypothetical protein